MALVARSDELAKIALYVSLCHAATVEPGLETECSFYMMLEQVNRIGAELGFRPVETGMQIHEAIRDAVQRIEQLCPPEPARVLRSRFELIRDGLIKF